MTQLETPGWSPVGDSPGQGDKKILISFWALKKKSGEVYHERFRQQLQANYFKRN
jgi:hypothetical protein